MGKGQRNRAQSARDRIVAQQAAAKRADRRRQTLIAGGSILTVLVVVVVFILVKSLSGTSASTAGGSANGDPQPAVAKAITSVPASILDAVGSGPTGANKIGPLVPVANAPALTQGGKPEVLYVGAEYCPYCAAERWAMTVALSRFGTFSGLHFTHSSSTDAYSNTPTLTFYKSSYTSKYLSFTPVEWFNRNGNGTSDTLQPPTATQMAIFQKYDAAPYVPSTSAGSFPFVDLGNKYLIVGAQFLPSVFGTQSTPTTALLGISWAQVAKGLQSSKNPIAQNVLGAANMMTAGLCKLTNNQPANVCSSAAVTAGASGL
jgi:thiol-disulfide isomerase/thioredoxin